MRRMLIASVLITCPCQSFAGMLAGNALRFDSQDDEVQVPASPDFDFGTAFTIEVWVHPEAILNAFPRILERYDNSFARLTFALQSGGQTFNSYFLGNDVRATTVVPLDVWSHLAVRYDGSTASLFLNGSLVHSQGASLVNIDLNAILRIGDDYAGNRQYIGLMDELRMWTVARTDLEIGHWYNRLISTNAAGLVAYWDFNTGSGNTLFDRAGSNDGTIYGASWEESCAPIVPEPASITLWLIAAASFGTWRHCWRRRLAFQCAKCS